MNSNTARALLALAALGDGYSLHHSVDVDSISLLSVSLQSTRSRLFCLASKHHTVSYIPTSKALWQPSQPMHNHQWFDIYHDGLPPVVLTTQVMSNAFLQHPLCCTHTAKRKRQPTQQAAAQPAATGLADGCQQVAQ